MGGYSSFECKPKEDRFEDFRGKSSKNAHSKRRRIMAFSTSRYVAICRWRAADWRTIHARTDSTRYRPSNISEITGMCGHKATASATVDRSMKVRNLEAANKALQTTAASFRLGERSQCMLIVSCLSAAVPELTSEVIRQGIFQDFFARLLTGDFPSSI